MDKAFEWPEFDTDFPVSEHTILLSLAGSRSYGTEHPLSDTDYKGIMVIPKSYYTSPFKSFEQTSWKSEEKSGRVSEIDGVVEADEEGTIFDLRKFLRLASSCNPNVVEVLFTDDKHLVAVTEEGRILREHGNLFLSQLALQTFTGYAMSQLKRIRGHKKFLDDPPKETPTRKKFGLPEEKIIRPDQIAAARAYIENHTKEIVPWIAERDKQHEGAFWEGMYKIMALLLQELDIEFDIETSEWKHLREHAYDHVAQSLGFDANFIKYLKQEKAYSQKRLHYKQYRAWQKNRNPARAELESKYGYDCKHASHLVRLLRCGEEVLTKGTLTVFRPDREELKLIRNGGWEYDDLVSWSEEQVEKLYDLVREGKAVVPVEPDFEKIEELSVRLHEMAWKRVGV